MPELPEVETIANTLQQGGPNSPSLVGREVVGVNLLWEGALVEPSTAEFKRRIIGQSIEDVGRRAKYIWFRLTQDHLLIHLRMSGDLLVGEGSEPLGSYARLIFYLDGDLQLAFNDARKFGRTWLLRDPQTILERLGPEPLDPNFSAEAFYQGLHKRKRQIKPLLMDQTFLAGIGNIYVDEALYLASIHPTTRAHLLSKQQAGKLYKSIRHALREGIERNGASIDWVYRGGDFQNYFKVYQRTGEPCERCDARIERTVVAQRGTHYCPKCQIPIA